jgi:hypothetical protein
MKRHVLYILFLVGKDMLYEKQSRNSNYDKKNGTEENISILEKIRKKNQLIWSSYEEEKQFTSFIQRLKTEIALAMN